MLRGGGRPPWYRPSVGLPEYADATDADFCRVRYRLARHQPDVQLGGVESPGQMQLVDDVGDLEHEGKAISRVLAIRRRCLADAEQRNAAGLQFGMPGRVFAIGNIDVDAKDSGVVEAAHVLQIEEDA